MADRPVHVLRAIGFSIERVGSELHGVASVVSEMAVPGTSTLRISILATWVDMLTGLLAVGVVQPRVPATLQLDVNLHRPPREVAEVRMTARIVKAGRSGVVSAVDLRDGRDQRLGGGTALFTVAGDPELRMTADLDQLVAQISEPAAPLPAPFADHVGCERVVPGVAEIALSPARRNASDTLNGGLLALLVEEAVLSARSSTSLSMLSMRYLRPVRTGPALATASLHADLADVSVVDAGRDDIHAVMATARCFPADLRR
jgi:acyl-coenzyme A thioesterase PaaI-like protein